MSIAAAQTRVLLYSEPVEGRMVMLALLACGGPNTDLVLITEEEAAQKEAVASRGEDVLAGPKIILHAPEANGRIAGPIDIDVEIGVGASGKEPDLDSLKVYYRKFIDLDVTGRLKPHLSGNRLKKQGLSVPSGRHRFRVEISDVGGTASVQHFEFTKQ